MRRVTTVLAILLMGAGVLAQGTARSGGQAPPAATKPQPVDKAFAPLQGTWVVNDINGKPAGSMLLAFKGDKYEVTANDAVNERGTVKLNTSQKPIAIDLVIQEGTDAGKLQLGIIEVTGDKMRLKLAAPADTTRPKSFEGEGGFIANLTKRK
jgi:uncharacterized protein (TIGR03067 family)